MSAPARLLALRLQGFKSFAERTLVEFGPGISAVVGPNGSGKSNLADALRWALGEQGRALRSRKSEDVIFAGSERRSALGMADVSLLLDNSDRLLPVEYGQLELGRRLYRSGENDYLLNRQRVRLRDLVDLLDAAHLADNAFLFIGQGMVDQALALRPEERRPLFEEVAGVRRHDRRRRQAEGQLIEAEANLGRVEDVLAELRPQVRRLAAQAEQQASHLTAGRAYGHAIVAAAHARWHEGAAQAAIAGERLRRGRAEADRAMAALREAEEDAAALARSMAARSAQEQDRRAAHEAARTTLTTLQVRAARLWSEIAAIERERRRLESERTLAEADLAVQRRTMALPVPARDAALGEALGEVERALSDALEELAALRAARQARGEALAALRRAEAARTAELETSRRRLAEADRLAVEERLAADAAGGRQADLEARLRELRAATVAAGVAEQAAGAAREEARSAAEEREAHRRAATERAAEAGARLAAGLARLESLRARLAEEEERPIARAARRHGGRLVEEGLEVEPGLLEAVEAALGDAARAYLVERGAVTGLAAERGTLIVDAPELAPAARPAAAGDADGPAVGRIVERVAEAGGGRLVDAIRRDPTGAVRRLLARVVWLPELRAALGLQPLLGPGWIAVTRDGAVVSATGLIAFGRTESRLERRAEAGRLAGEAERLAAAEQGAAEAAAAADAAARVARVELDAARAAESRVAVSRRAAEEDERRIGRETEAAAREAAWHAAQSDRLTAERERLGSALAAQQTAAAQRADAGGAGGAEGGPEGEAIRGWEARAAELRVRRDRLAAEEAEQDRTRRAADERRALAAAAIGLDEERLTRADREAADLDGREGSLGLERETLDSELAAATARELEARDVLDHLRAADAADRERLATAEDSANAARERLRAAEERTRSAEVADLEARLGLDAVREQTLVELAGLGDMGLRLLAEAGATAAEEALAAPHGIVVGTAGLPSAASAAHADVPEVLDADDPGDESERQSSVLETALAELVGGWAAAPPLETPTPARLASLRRRFHDLGAANPFAVEEHTQLRGRLDGLETQRNDLLRAISQTRVLIEELNGLIADQFRATFRALETAFDTRFRKLFGGGFARLSLTEPDDLASTGVEIVARPPGKKAQALAMLSGGERALTAVALLFAMLEVRPVPFCVLDEVDAALDEANIGRFAESLRGLATQTQFIVITHNRGTIESADALYGVTIGDDAVSRVISLRLEEARELAERSRPRDALSAAGAG